MYFFQYNNNVLDYKTPTAKYPYLSVSYSLFFTFTYEKTKYIRHAIPYGLLGWGECTSLKSLLVCISFFI